MTQAKNPPSGLYKRDYYGWVQDQVQALRARRVEDVDWENVAEEVEDLGKSERRAIESQLVRLIEHLLKLQFAPDAVVKSNAREWELTIRDARLMLRRLLEQSPSLRPQMPEMFQFAYQRGRLVALRKTRLPDDAIPESCPWDVEEVMDEVFWPRV